MEYGFLGIGLIAAMVLVWSIYVKFKILKLIAKIIIILSVVGALFFYLEGLGFDFTKLFFFS